MLVTKVRKGAPAHRIGVLPGDVVRQIDSQVIESLEDYAKVMLRLRFKDHAVLALQRNNQIHFVTVNFLRGR